MIRKVFVTSSFYALSHQLGMGEAMNVVQTQCKASNQPTPPLDPTPGTPWLPAVKTIARISRFAEVHMSIDAGATYIGMARSRAFHEAYKSGFPWIAIDDDIECHTSTVGGMLEALDDIAPRVILTPYPLRHPDRGKGLAVMMPNVRVERTIGTGIQLCALEKGHGGGMGFVGMNTAAMKLIADYCPPELAWVDEDGTQKRALFYEKVEDMCWYGEDVSFFRWRVPPEITIELLLAGTIAHAGIALDLTTL